MNYDMWPVPYSPQVLHFVTSLLSLAEIKTFHLLDVLSNSVKYVPVENSYLTQVKYIFFEKFYGKLQEVRIWERKGI